MAISINATNKSLYSGIIEAKLRTFPKYINLLRNQSQAAIIPVHIFEDASEMNELYNMMCLHISRVIDSRNSTIFGGYIRDIIRGTVPICMDCIVDYGYEDVPDIINDIIKDMTYGVQQIYANHRYHSNLSCKLIQDIYGLIDDRDYCAQYLIFNTEHNEIQMVINFYNACDINIYDIIQFDVDVFEYNFSNNNMSLMPTYRSLHDINYISIQQNIICGKFRQLFKNENGSYTFEHQCMIPNSYIADLMLRKITIMEKYGWKLVGYEDCQNPNCPIKNRGHHK